MGKSSMSPVPLLATCWTHAGDAAPQRGDERSPFNILERIQALGEVGWTGIGLVHADLIAARDNLGYASVRESLEKAGIKNIEIEFLGDWWTDGVTREASDQVRRDLFEAASALGAQSMKVAGQMFEKNGDLKVMASEFDRLADEAAEINLKVSLEPLPFSNFATVAQGFDFAQRVNNQNAGVIIDLWHLYRGGNIPADLPSIVDPAFLFAVELNDAREPAPAPEHLWADTVDNRLLPGEGDWDVPGFISELQSLGFQGPWGVEILSDEHRERPLIEAVSLAYHAALSQFPQNS